MSKMNYILPLALLISGVVNAATENPWYAGARVGGTSYSGLSIDSRSSDIDKEDWGGGAFLGYNIVPWFAVEGGYTYLGEMDFKADDASIEQQGLDLVGKFTWNVTNSIDLFAKAGGFYYFTDGSGAISGSDDGIIGTAGVGAEYFFNKNLSARLEYQYYNDLELKDASWDTHFYGISLVYGWGAPVPVAVVEPEPEPAPVPVMVQVEPITVALPFAFDSDTLSQQDIDQLQPIAQRLVNFPETELFVIGHTDSRGAEAYNQNLSEERAAVVAGYLATHFGIEQSRIQAQGRGELEPVATNDTEDGRGQNRRVEVFTPGFEMEGQ
ncbi:OmpA family protein [Photobacterium profundum]|uniref:Hypothetical outer membrane protein OmpA n=1 Tax=Photobacterium profundum (strain SS9) TaxID=298386 RepID=Q6LJL5_PHOPR|nr:OmpA family protein [Photobacterium profundum]CAG22515.1 hypothetical outer membrane protein OmpA [Photobacterium profundum SS9]